MSSAKSRHAAYRHRCVFLFPALLAAVAVHGQALSGADLVRALHQGGHVIVMRHASSPRTPPDPAQADAANLGHERQLDETRRSSASAMGDALRRLHIPVGAVLSSPTYRALETVRLARFGAPETYAQLGDGGQSMQADSSTARAAWLKLKAVASRHPHTNTIVVTHFPNMMEAFAQSAAGLADGEAMIFRPDGRGGATLVARVKIDEWPEFNAP